MKLIVGLGNPGDEYARTRHNIGFLVVGKLALRHGIALGTRRMRAVAAGEFRQGRQTVILVTPLTYMNLSGFAVRDIARRRRIAAEDVLVVYDDMDLAFGRMKILADGSSGGHKGLASVVHSLGTSRVARLRLGIGRPRRGEDPADYVLSPFSRDETASLGTILERACDCCDTWASAGMTRAMNVFNSIVKEEAP
jgi:PTH1 family peptidyl-tRNA hydrolase